MDDIINKIMNKLFLAYQPIHNADGGTVFSLLISLLLSSLCLPCFSFAPPFSLEEWGKIVE